MLHRASLAGLATLAAISLACSSLPEHAAPKGEVRASGNVDLSDVVSYRTLARSDFKGIEPPAQFGAAADSIGAATCAYVVASPGARFINRPVRSSDGTLRYEATPQELRYSAQMDRKCSWWNPKDLGIPQEYILEHEQIHFAIFELEARRLNATVETELRATAATPEAASGSVQKQLDAELRARLAAVLARSRDFDEDTSMGHKPEVQKRWLARVRAELAATGGN